MCMLRTMSRPMEHRRLLISQSWGQLAIVPSGVQLLNALRQPSTSWPSAAAGFLFHAVTCTYIMVSIHV